MHDCPYCGKPSGHSYIAAGETDSDFCVTCKECGERCRVDHDCQPDGCAEVLVKRDAPDTY